MVTVHALGDGPWSTWLRSLTGGGDWVVFAKGAVEVILGLSSQVWTAHGPSPLDESARMDILARHELLAGEGMRVLGVAFSALREPPEKYVPTHGLIFVGMVGMADSLRPEASDALCTCRKAGIRVLLVTGDHPATALRVARQLELDAAVLTGADLESMTVEELARRVEEVTVYARVSPEHKLKIVDALRKRGQVVAMTGDDVNDAPALRRADIGVAMGRIGTDAAREAADLELLDDNFATIVAAIREGRVIYDNIRKKGSVTVTINSAELWVMLPGPVVGMPLPLLPPQTLWANLVTDGLPALALTAEPPEEDVMRRPPRDPKEALLTRRMGRTVIVGGLAMAVVSLGLGYAHGPS